MSTSIFDCNPIIGLNPELFAIWNQNIQLNVKLIVRFKKKWTKNVCCPLLEKASFSSPKQFMRIIFAFSLNLIPIAFCNYLHLGFCLVFMKYELDLVWFLCPVAYIGMSVWVVFVMTCHAHACNAGNIANVCWLLCFSRSMCCVPFVCVCVLVNLTVELQHWCAVMGLESEMTVSDIAISNMEECSYHIHRTIHKNVARWQRENQLWRQMTKVSCLRKHRNTILPLIKRSTIWLRFVLVLNNLWYAPKILEFQLNAATTTTTATIHNGIVCVCTVVIWNLRSWPTVWKLIDSVFVRWSDTHTRKWQRCVDEVHCETNANNM